MRVFSNRKQSNSCHTPQYYFFECGLPMRRYCGIKDAVSVLMSPGIVALMTLYHIYLRKTAEEHLTDPTKISSAELLERDHWYLAYKIYKDKVPKVEVFEKDTTQFEQARKNLTDFLMPPEIRKNIALGAQVYQKVTKSQTRPKITGYTVVNSLFEQNLKIGRNTSDEYKYRDEKLVLMLKKTMKNFGSFETKVLAVDFHIIRDIGEEKRIPLAYPHPHPIYYGWDRFNSGYFHAFSFLGSALEEDLDLDVKIQMAGLQRSIASEELLKLLFKMVIVDPTGAMAKAQIQLLGQTENQATETLEKLLNDSTIASKVVEKEYQATADSKLAFLNIGDNEAKFIEYGTQESEKAEKPAKLVRGRVTKHLLKRFFILMQIGLNAPFGIVHVTNAESMDAYLTNRIKSLS